MDYGLETATLCVCIGGMQRLNQKDLRVLKLYEKGMDITRIAEKCGYTGKMIGEGVERVKDALRRAGKTEKL